MCSNIIDERTICTVEGSAFAMSKHMIDLFEDSNIKKNIDLTNTNSEQQQAVKKNNDQENYQVVGMDEARQINPSFSMFNMDDLKLSGADSSRKTSASTV